MTTSRPTRQELEAAAGSVVPDLVEPGVRLVFCGINPGLWSGAVGHHFARPGNRFWKVLHESGFTGRVLDPSEEQELLGSGLGITNLVARATATASELSRDEPRAGTRHVAKVVTDCGVAWVAFLGMGAYRTAFGRPKAVLGEQPELLGSARVWLLPNPSGLQARYQLADLVELFSELRRRIQ